MTAKKELKKKRLKESLSMSAISNKLATDSSFSVQPLPEPSTVCCLAVHKVAIFGLTFNTTIFFAFYVYVLVRLFQTAKEPQHNTEIIAVGSLLMCFVLCFSVLFVWGVMKTRHRLLIPYIVLNSFIFFAFAGTVIASLITVADEVREEVIGEDRTSKIVDILLFRAALVLLAVFQMFFIYSFIRAFIDVRRLHVYRNPA